MKTQRKSVCIITFSPVAQDVRVLRQIEYLSQRYDVSAIGEGDKHPSWQKLQGFTWVPTLKFDPAMSFSRAIEKLSGLSMLATGHLHPSMFYRWYWRQPIMKDVLAKAIATGADVFHANDWNALPLAVEAAAEIGARVVFDAHEFAPLEFSNRLKWRLAYSRMIRQMLHKYAPRADASVTVAPAIAERYRREFGINPTVVLNAPALPSLPPNRELDFANVRLIHHGAAISDRRLEVMIRALALSDKRFTLHFMLTSRNNTYVDRLRNLGQEITPGRVFFHEPVPPEQVVARVADFDLGFCYIAPTNYNYLVSLPNKFFDFIAAGLPVCIGPSPSMAEIVEGYRLGCVAQSFEAPDIAAALNSLTAERMAELRKGARIAASQLNAEQEMKKLLEIYDRLLHQEK